MCDYCWIIIVENIVLEIFDNFNSCDFWKKKSNLIILGIIGIANYCGEYLIQNYRNFGSLRVWENGLIFLYFGE